MNTEQQNEWVSVKERLPENFTIVQIWSNTSVYRSCAYYGSKDWLIMTPSENFWVSTQPHIEVLFWKELSQPPKQ